MSYILYEERKYLISEFMLSNSNLIKEILLNSNDTEIHMSMFENEFKALNSQTFNITQCKTVEDINKSYQLLGYFGIDSLIYELDIHVLITEMFRESNNHFYKFARMIQFSSLPLNETLFERYLEKIHWKTLCKNTSVPEEFLEKHLNLISWRELSENSGISEGFFERHLKNVQWYFLCKNEGISEAFFERHFDKLVWVFICQNTNMSESFFERHLEMVNWRGISKNSALSEEFFNKYIRNLDWDVVCVNTNISEEFFERNIRRCDFSLLSMNISLSEAFFEKHLDRVDWYWLSQNSNMSEEFFERHLDLVHPKCISRNKNISESFYLKHFNKLEWKDEKWEDGLIYNPNVTLEFIIEHFPEVIDVDYHLLPVYKINFDNLKGKYCSNSWIIM